MVGLWRDAGGGSKGVLVSWDVFPARVRRISACSDKTCLSPATGYVLANAIRICDCRGLSGRFIVNMNDEILVFRFVETQEMDTVIVLVL